jgi:phenylacetate-CoA ligase
VSLLRIAGHFARAQWAFTHLRGRALADYQNRRARAVVRYAAARSPFYRDHWAGHDLADWRSLPTVDKPLMMALFGAFNTAGVSEEDALAVALRAEESRDFAPTLPGGLTVGLSSGTSGHRGLFLVSPAETAAWAGTVLARTLHRVPPRGYRVAFFLRSNSNLYERVGASRRVVFRWFDLMTPLAEAVAKLNDYAPALLVGPPSLLRMLAGEAARGALRARPGRLLSVAEVLEPEDRAHLEAAFGVAVHQVYQCTEGLLAATCPAGRLHVQEDLVALQYEPLDPADPLRASPIVTDLWRRTQPIVRYRLSDVLRLRPADALPCPCGSAFRVIDAVDGRCDDVLYFFESAAGKAHRDALRPFFPDTVRRAVLLADPCVADYAAEQDRPGNLHLFLDVADGAPFDAIAAAVRESVASVVAQYGCRPAEIELERGVPATAPGAKRRRVRRLWDGPAA